MKARSRYGIARGLLIFWCLFIGIGAVAGAVGMLTAIDGSNLGMQELLPYFQVLPFAEYLFGDFLFPGIALLCVNGIPNLIAAALMLKRKKAGVVCGTVFGVTLMAWICIQFVIFPSNFMSDLYFDFGILQALTGCAALIFYEQENFCSNSEDYPNVGTDKSRLVVYFSRMGYTRREALEAANRTGAVLYEIRATERTEGTLGFWWCGRFGMHGRDMPIRESGIDLSNYSHVTVCTPVWVFATASPTRAFCRAENGKIRQADYIITHFNPMKYASVAEEMDALLGIRAQSVESVCVRWGKVKKREKLR